MHRPYYIYIGLCIFPPLWGELKRGSLSLLLNNLIPKFTDKTKLL
jgi:hypothetical protein